VVVKTGVTEAGDHENNGVEESEADPASRDLPAQTGPAPRDPQGGTQTDDGRLINDVDGELSGDSKYSQQT